MSRHITKSGYYGFLLLLSFSSGLLADRTQNPDPGWNANELGMSFFAGMDKPYGRCVDWYSSCWERQSADIWEEGISLSDFNKPLSLQQSQKVLGYNPSGQESYNRFDHGVVSRFARALENSVHDRVVVFQKVINDSVHELKNTCNERSGYTDSALRSMQESSAAFYRSCGDYMVDKVELGQSLTLALKFHLNNPVAHDSLRSDDFSWAYTPRWALMTIAKDSANAGYTGWVELLIMQAGGMKMP